jgi:KaiC/GvpD/RAD55 family RecA-like ATPase
MNLVASYIDYLRNAAKRITTRTGMENVFPLPRSTKRAIPPYFDAADSLAAQELCRTGEITFYSNDEKERNLHLFLESVRNDSIKNKAVFMGLGLIDGKYEDSMLSAPFIYGLVEMLIDDETGEYTLVLQEDTLQLNHEAIAKILHVVPDSESNLERVLAKEATQILTRIEDALDNVPAPQEIDTHAIFQTLQRSIEAFSSIAFGEDPFDYKFRAATVKTGAKPHATMYTHTFLFSAAIPGELSTYHALNSLRKQETIANPLVNLLFENTLLGRNVEFPAVQDVSEKAIHDILKTLMPISLSLRQRKALFSAWEQSLSYIQGPPGTGKSHTITALMLSAALLGKSVLFVSHKKAAINVVKEKIDAILGEEALLYIGSESADKTTTKKHLEELLSLGRTEVAALATKYAEAVRKLEQIQTELDASNDAIRRGVEQERQYAELFQIFLQQSDTFQTTFRPDGFTQHSFVAKRYNTTKYHHALEKYERITAELTDYTQKKSITRLERLFHRKAQQHFQREFASAAWQPVAHTMQRQPKYASMLFQMNHHFSEADFVQRSINMESLEEHRRFAAVLAEQKNTFLRQLLPLRHQYTIAALLQGERGWRPQKDTVTAFKSVLHWRNTARLQRAMGQVDFPLLTQTLPLWCAELRDLGSVLPQIPELFDMVIIDEASQVNIPEIIPAMYRGKRLCVVGDEKQLSLNATGVGFSLSKDLDLRLWESALGRDISYTDAKERRLTVTDSSVLDFINSARTFHVEKTELDEHFRSLPLLAAFNNRTFYDGSWKIMTENGVNLEKPCFKAIRVEGQRDTKRKFIQEEIDATRALVQAIIRNQGYKRLAELIPHNFQDAQPPSIGIVSILTEQASLIREMLTDSFSEQEIEQYHLVVGTPEEFQGNERDIIILTLGLDGVSAWGKAHYENPNRFNVATSRAKYFTYLIYAGLPSNASLIRKYFQTMNVLDTSIEDVHEEIPRPDELLWAFDEDKCESDFEHRVLNVLRQYADARQCKLYNQVQACGQKRLDFVLYSPQSERTCAVEVDGAQHFENTSTNYTEQHLERAGILRRAGWRIVHIKYYRWFANGWLCENRNPIFQQEIHRLYQELDNQLAFL